MSCSCFTKPENLALAFGNALGHGNPGMGTPSVSGYPCLFLGIDRQIYSN